MDKLNTLKIWHNKSFKNKYLLDFEYITELSDKDLVIITIKHKFKLLDGKNVLDRFFLNLKPVYRIYENNSYFVNYKKYVYNLLCGWFEQFKTIKSKYKNHLFNILFNEIIHQIHIRKLLGHYEYI